MVKLSQAICGRDLPCDQCILGILVITLVPGCHQSLPPLKEPRRASGSSRGIHPIHQATTPSISLLLFYNTSHPPSFFPFTYLLFFISASTKHHPS